MCRGGAASTPLTDAIAPRAAQASINRRLRMSEKIALVTGAGGFIGHHLVKYLKRRGYYVRGADIKEPEYERTAADEFRLIDLRYDDACQSVTAGVDEVYHLAADMG